MSEKKQSLIAHAKELAKKLEKVLADATNKHKNPVAVLAEFRNIEKQWKQMLKDSLTEGIFSQDEFDTNDSLFAFVSTRVAAQEKKNWKENTATVNAREAIVFQHILDSANAGIAEKEKQISAE